MAEDLENGAWREALPEELREAPALKDVKDVAGLAKSFVDQQAYLGNAIRPPGPEASEEQREDFFRKLQEHAGDHFMPRPNADDPEQMNALAKAMGRPDEAAGYVAPQVPEGSIPIDEARFQAFREVAHKAGLTQKQMEAIVSAELEAETKAYNDQAANLKQSRLDLQREWGLTFEDRSKAAFNFAAQTGAPKSLLDAMESGNVDGATLQWMHKLREAVGGESSEISKQPGTGSDTLDPGEAMARVNEITTKLSTMAPHDPDYQRLISKRMEYLRMADPKAATTLDNLRAGAGGGPTEFDREGVQY